MIHSKPALELSFLFSLFTVTPITAPGQKRPHFKFEKLLSLRVRPCRGGEDHA